MVIRNAAGQAQHIAANYRPLNTSLLLSRLIREYLMAIPLVSISPIKKFDYNKYYYENRNQKSNSGKG
jgi:hypothetical protein